MPQMVSKKRKQNTRELKFSDKVRLKETGDGYDTVVII